MKIDRRGVLIGNNSQEKLISEIVLEFAGPHSVHHGYAFTNVDPNQIALAALVLQKLAASWIDPVGTAEPVGLPLIRISFAGKDDTRYALLFEGIDGGQLLLAADYLSMLANVAIRPAWQQNFIKNRRAAAGVPDIYVPGGVQKGA